MGLHVKKGLLDRLINRLIPKEIIKTRNYMEHYEWKQWVGFKKLHAVRRWDRYEGGYDTHIASCGVAQTQFDIFVEPPITTVKCKNCESKLIGK